MFYFDSIDIRNCKTDELPKACNIIGGQIVRISNALSTIASPNCEPQVSNQLGGEGLTNLEYFLEHFLFQIISLDIPSYFSIVNQSFY